MSCNVVTGNAIQTNEDTHKNVRIEKVLFLHFAIHLYGTSSCNVTCINSKPASIHGLTAKWPFAFFL